MAVAKSIRKRILAAGVWLGLTAMLALPASADPVTYLFTSGFATINAVRLDTLAEVLEPTEVPLDGVYVTFDADTITLTDFLVTVPTTGTITLAQPYGGNTQFVIESASLQPGSGFATLFGSVEGPGQYSFLAGPIDIDGVYSIPPAAMNCRPVHGRQLPVGQHRREHGLLHVDRDHAPMESVQRGFRRGRRRARVLRHPLPYGRRHGQHHGQTGRTLRAHARAQAHSGQVKSIGAAGL